MDNFTLIIYISIIVGSFVIINIKKLNFLDTVIWRYPRLTYWSLTHFFWFFIFGLLAPNSRVILFILGLLWEIIEKLYGKYTNKEKYWTSNGIIGQITDLVMNMVGYELGHSLYSNTIIYWVIEKIDFHEYTY